VKAELLQVTRHDGLVPPPLAGGGGPQGRRWGLGTVVMNPWLSVPLQLDPAIAARPTSVRFAATSSRKGRRTPFV
jgi:hypothetical protein